MTNGTNRNYDGDEFETTFYIDLRESLAVWDPRLSLR